MHPDSAPDPKPRPFGVILKEPATANLTPIPEDDDWSPAELEAEYQRAVEAAEQAELLSELTFDELGSITPPLEPTGTAIAGNLPASSPETAAASPTADAVELAQVLEALVFVGGAALTSARLADVVGTSTGQIEDAIDELNRRYRSESRPYAIRHAEGGYRLSLGADFENVRNRVHGHGPKEVRLAGETLEILALVAYQQPVSREQIADSGKPDAEAQLRQLIRRDLVAIERIDGRDVRYHTTPRFLDLFGLRSLDDLPRAEDFRFK